MLTAEATITTENPSRYLAHLCEHATKVGHKLRHLHSRSIDTRPEILGTDWTDTQGTLHTNWGECTMQASQNTLALRIDADTEEHLQRIQDIIASDLERFGRRERLTVNWRLVQADEAG